MNNDVFKSSGPIGEDDLQAYIDQRLDPDRRREVETYLDSSPIARARVNELRDVTTILRNSLEAHAQEPLPPRLRMSAIRHVERQRALQLRWRYAASVALLMTGFGLGVLLDRPSASTPQRLPMADAMSAHRVFARASTGVEIDASRGMMLASRVSDHLGHSIAIPNLSDLGLSFLGGRLLSSDEGPGGMFLFGEPDDNRIAVYVKTLADGRRSEFGSRRDDDLVAYFWFDGRLGYAVTGRASSALLTRTAEKVRDTYR
jgi:anti-sigma factor RsiW